MNKKAFSLIEVMFATAIMCVLFFAMTSQFISSKKTHYKSAEYLNKVYLAETILKLLKDQVYINPNFFLNINNTYIKKSVEKDSYAYKVFLDEVYADPIASENFEFKVSNVPVIRHAKENGKPKSYYFGFFKIEDLSPANTENDKTANVLLNIKDAEKYFFDLEINNEKNIALEGMLKNITVTVKSTINNDPPFTVSTKALCPPESLDSQTYTKFQNNLFTDSQKELQTKIDKLLPEKSVLDKTIKGDDGLTGKIYDNILKLLRPKNKNGVPGLIFIDPKLINQYYDVQYDGIGNVASSRAYAGKISEMIDKNIEKNVAELIKKVYFILYVIDFNRYIQTQVYDQEINDIKDASNSKTLAADVKKLINIYTDKAQLALQTIDLIQPPFVELNQVLTKGTTDTVSVMLTCFLHFSNSYPVDDEKNIVDALSDELPEIKKSFGPNGIHSALKKVNELFSNEFNGSSKLSPAEIYNYTRQLIAFNQLNQIMSKIGKIPAAPSEDAADNIIKLKNKFAGDNYYAEIAYLTTEEKKNKNLNTLIDDKFSVIRN
ncbi:MAG TPA: type II secretion system protein, partial [Candidatus Wallbacteria bacterium]|nr:type II secretion system protein [Candidatus Wallbacteria bacterium]